MYHKHVPFKTRSGLQIGIAWQPPLANTMDRDMQTVQAALLHHGPRVRRRRRVLDLLCWVGAIGLLCLAKYLSR